MVNIYVGIVERVYADSLLARFDSPDFRGSQVETEMPDAMSSPRISAHINRYYIGEDSPFYTDLDPLVAYSSGDKVALLCLQLRNPATGKLENLWHALGKYRD